MHRSNNQMNKQIPLQSFTASLPATSMYVPSGHPFITFDKKKTNINQFVGILKNINNKLACEKNQPKYI